jgi:hypothetical protein
MKTEPPKGAEPAFRSFWLNDVNPVSGQKKRRQIHNPNQPMRDLHARMIGYVRRLGVRMPSSAACRRGQSALKNVMRHRKYCRDDFNRYFYLADISSAYQAVSLDRMVDVLFLTNPRLTNSRDDVRGFLEQHFFDAKNGGLVVGGPASPDLFNLYCEVVVDRELRELCQKYEVMYTRYLDDLTFSSQRPIGAKKRRALRRIAEAAGFRISDRKARVYDLRKGPVSVNGIGICLDGRVFLPRRTLRHIRGLLHVACTKGGINPGVIHGKMGLLKGLVSPGKANRTELKVFRQYERFRQLHALSKTGSA